MNDRIFILFFRPFRRDWSAVQRARQYVLQHQLDKSGNLHLATARLFSFNVYSQSFIDF